ncbi:MAG: Fic family protein [Propionibacteriaceae bacterium]|nr:Fic family protein [Propionibacteriaceae bacterium]
MKSFFVEQPEWGPQVIRINTVVEAVEAAEKQAANLDEVRQNCRIASVHASVALEGNRLTEDEVCQIVGSQVPDSDGRDIEDVRNVWVAYQQLGTFDPYNKESFLRAHAMMTAGLVAQSGMFRTGNVEVVDCDDSLVHTGADPALIPEGVQQLLEWAQTTNDHRLVIACATHHMIEFIHPFQDGNGPIGRLWQTLLLGRWHPVLAWVPAEAVVYERQTDYYHALQASHGDHIEASPFITYMLDVIEEALRRYQGLLTVATEAS